MSVEFDPLRLLRTLHDHDASFIVVGGMAARAHGSPSVTRDPDICFERSRPNLEALARALRELHARPRGIDPDLPFQVDASALALGDHFTLTTDAGAFNCLGTPAGTGGFSDLARNAVALAIEDAPVLIASLDDLIRMKRAAGRPKDRIELRGSGGVARGA